MDLPAMGFLSIFFLLGSASDFCVVANYFINTPSSRIILDKETSITNSYNR